jgi:hypothetical protein
MPACTFSPGVSTSVDTEEVLPCASACCFGGLEDWRRREARRREEARGSARRERERRRGENMVGAVGGVWGWG